MGNKQPKEVSTDLTEKRLFFEDIHYRMKFCFFLILEIALLKANTKYNETGISIHNHFLSN